MAETWTAERVKEALEREGILFVTVAGRRMMITNDEEVTGLYAWPDGVESRARVWFGDEGDGAEENAALWINSDGADGNLWAGASDRGDRT